MNTYRSILHIMCADFFERTRSKSFLIVAGLAVFASYIFIPAKSANYITCYVSKGKEFYRGAYNSAWIGSNLALLISVFFSLFGFYLVKSSIEHDRLTGVGQIIAATPLKKTDYILGKLFSNFAVLSALALISATALLIVQLMRREVSSVNLIQLFSPFVIIVFPTMIFISALAVLFETVPVLRGSFGNIVYFFVWMVFYITLIQNNQNPNIQVENTPLYDVFGMSTLLQQILGGARLALHDPNIKWLEIYRHVSGIQIKTYLWKGIIWDGGVIALRFMWIGISLIIAFFAAMIFKGFDVNWKEKKSVGNILRFIKNDTEPVYVKNSMSNVVLSKFKADSMRFSFIYLLGCEIKLIIRGLHWWWILGAIVLILCELFLPMGSLRNVIYPLALIWPINILSSTGIREKRYNTEQIIFSCPKPASRQFLVCWLAEIAIIVIIQSGIGLHLVIAGNYFGLFAWLAGVAFVPTLAIMLGTWSGGSRLFEIIYTIIWYMGPLNKIPTMDFPGISNTSACAIIPIAYFVISFILLGMALIGRHYRTRL
ncbi:MAG: ABC-2 transporter permease [Bacillota bacterium]|nr:ABC-2 transporter permease [Bacillota bacterium]